MSLKRSTVAKFFISLFEIAFKMTKNGVYFIMIALLVAELCKILILCKLEDLWRHNVDTDVKPQKSWISLKTFSVKNWNFAHLLQPSHSSLIWKAKTSHFALFWFSPPYFCSFQLISIYSGLILVSFRLIPVSFCLVPFFGIASSHFFLYVNYCNFVTWSFV